MTQAERDGKSVTSSRLVIVGDKLVIKYLHSSHYPFFCLSSAEREKEKPFEPKHILHLDSSPGQVMEFAREKATPGSRRIAAREVRLLEVKQALQRCRERPAGLLCLHTLTTIVCLKQLLASLLDRSGETAHSLYPRT